MNSTCEHYVSYPDQQPDTGRAIVACQACDLPLFRAARVEREYFWVPTRNPIKSPDMRVRMGWAMVSTRRELMGRIEELEWLLDQANAERTTP